MARNYRKTIVIVTHNQNIAKMADVVVRVKNGKIQSCEEQAMMDSYDSFMEIMDFMVLIFVIAAIILGVIVLYNLGIMSYLERSRELATLKVLGFCDRHIGRLLIRQHFWLTVAGVLLGRPDGGGKEPKDRRGRCAEGCRINCLLPDNMV